MRCWPQRIGLLLSEREGIPEATLAQFERNSVHMDWVVARSGEVFSRMKARNLMDAGPAVQLRCICEKDNFLLTWVWAKVCPSLPKHFRLGV